MLVTCRFGTHEGAASVGPSPGLTGYGRRRAGLVGVIVLANRGVSRRPYCQCRTKRQAERRHLPGSASGPVLTGPRAGGRAVPF
jgi:hypothetical protein